MFARIFPSAILCFHYVPLPETPKYDLCLLLFCASKHHNTILKKLDSVLHGVVWRPVEAASDVVIVCGISCGLSALIVLMQCYTQCFKLLKDRYL